MAIPPEQSALEVFNQLFLQGTPAEVEAQIRELDTGRSILDVVCRQAQDSAAQRRRPRSRRLDQYFTSVRDLEHRLQESKGWEHKPKPVVTNRADRSDQPAQYMAKVRSCTTSRGWRSRPTRPAPSR